MIDLMNRNSLRARILGPSGIALVLAAGLATPALSQEAAPAAAATAEATPQVVVADEERGQVNRIIVRGNQRIDHTTVLSYLPIQPGDIVDPVTFDVAVRTLYRTNLFANVQLGMAIW